MHLCYKGTGLRQERALNGAHSVTVADYSFPCSPRWHSTDHVLRGSPDSNQLKHRAAYCPYIR